MQTRHAGFLLGILGGVLFLVAAVLTLLGGTIDVLTGHAGARGLLAAAGGFVIEGVLGVLVLVFAAVGARSSGDNSLVGGVVLIVLAVVTWLLVGEGVLLLLGGLFALLAGILFVLARR